MPPRPPPCRGLRINCTQNQKASQIQRRNYAAAAAATVPAPSPEQLTTSVKAVERYPPTQPPSYKPPQFRKSQLHRQYASLLQTTPLMLLFQHNNLLASEWAAVRRELYKALERASSSSAPAANDTSQIDSVRLQVIQTGIFAAALRVVEFYGGTDGAQPHPPPLAHSDADTTSTTSTPTHAREQESAPRTHLLSRAAFAATRIPSPESAANPSAADAAHTPRRPSNRKRNHPLHTLLSGPIAVLTFPGVTPAHLAAALSILAPTPGAASAFPAPRRRDVPSYHEPSVQAGIQKLLFLGARIDGRVFDQDGVRWVGGIKGGLDGLRAQLVALLQSVGAGVTGALEGAGRSLWVTMEGRRLDMEDRDKGASEGAGAPASDA